MLQKYIKYLVTLETMGRTLPNHLIELSCLGRVTPGVKDTSFLGSARGVKEAEDLFTRMEIVGFLRWWWWWWTNKHKNTAIYPGSGRPEPNNPTPGCLD